jgi:hypothetical protein
MALKGVVLRRAFDGVHLQRATMLAFRFGVLVFLATILSGKVTRADQLITFEDLNDGDSVTTQYAGVTFSNAVVLTAGISLDEFELPPESGVNVVLDNGGPITLVFDAPVLSFGGYFTYAEPLTVDGFDATDTLIASADSTFNSNLGLSGDPGSTPNEFIEVSNAAGISSVTITGDPGGFSFALDNATITSLPQTNVPEPTELCLLLAGFFVVFFSCIRWGRPGQLLNS